MNPLESVSVSRLADALNDRQRILVGILIGLSIASFIGFGVLYLSPIGSFLGEETLDVAFLVVLMILLAAWGAGGVMSRHGYRRAELLASILATPSRRVVFDDTNKHFVIEEHRSGGGAGTIPIVVRRAVISRRELDLIATAVAASYNTEQMLLNSPRPQAGAVVDSLGSEQEQTKPKPIVETL